MLEGKCSSVLTKSDLKNTLDTLNAACVPPRVCSVEAQSGIKELNGYYEKAEAIHPDTTVEAFLLGNKLAGAALDGVKGVWVAATGGVERTAVGSTGGAANIAAHEVYKDGLRAAMSKPTVSDPALAKIIDPLYRPNATVGSGSTADAIRHELATGQPVGGAFHSQKAEDSIRSLERWLTNNPTARQGDRAAAENVIKDMSNALGWK